MFVVVVGIIIMGGFIARRLVYGLGLLICVLVLNFFLLRLAPGDPAEVIAGDMGGITPEILASIRASYGLDKPLLNQLAIYLGRVAVGDFGYSYFFNQPVLTLIGLRVWATLLLVVTALSMALIVGVTLGAIASKRPHGLTSGLISIFATFGYATPVFWSGILMIILFASILPIFPAEGMASAIPPETLLGRWGDIAHHLVLPSVTLGFIFIAQYARLTRAGMIETLNADYIRTARAKGVPEWRVTYHHALRNAILPIITIAGLQFGSLISGATLVETVFNWPGMGRLAFDSILRRDYPTLLGILFFSSLLVVVANILTDLAYRFADPRIRDSREQT